MAEINFKQVEHHQVIVTKTMTCVTEDWEGNEKVTEEELRTYIAEGTTGDDEKDDFCWERVLEAECNEEEDIDWFSDRKGFTDIDRELLDD